MNIKKLMIIVILLFPMMQDIHTQDVELGKSDVLLFPENPPEHWPTYHLLHPGDVLEPFPADPNPIFYYKGRYHLHYLYYSHKGTDFRTRLAMAHVSSSDMIHWKFHPTVLNPKILGHAMLSGTGFFTKEGKPAIIYSDTERVLILYAQDDNLDSWSKPQEINVTDKSGNPVPHSVWDPDCWLDGDTYYSIGGGKNPDLKKSTDLKNWEYLGHLMHSDFPKNLGVTMDDDVSCPNMFKISDKWMLLCISHAFGCRYYIGDFKDEKYLPESHNLMNWEDVNKLQKGTIRTFGTYFAPESLLTPDGRRVMWAWLFSSGERMQEGVQSLPRELELPADKILRIKPLRELENLRYEEKGLADIVLKNRVAYPLRDMSGDAVEFEIVFGPLAGSYEFNSSS
jgi:beta-fructofuranosidase